MDNRAISQVRKRELGDALRGELELTLSDRVDRYLQVKPHEIVANTHFASVSTECAALFRDGHFYGCVAPTQAVAEALVRFVCLRNSCRASDNFEKNVGTLRRRGFINETITADLLKIWEGRDDYHHLNPNVEHNRQELEELARGKARLLVAVESEIFSFTVADGRLVPNHPKYWDISGDQAAVYLRIE